MWLHSQGITRPNTFRIFSLIQWPRAQSHSFLETKRSIEPAHFRPGTLKSCCTEKGFPWDQKSHIYCTGKPCCLEDSSQSLSLAWLSLIHISISSLIHIWWIFYLILYSHMILGYLRVKYEENSLYLGHNAVCNWRLKNSKIIDEKWEVPAWFLAIWGSGMRGIISKFDLYCSFSHDCFFP